MIATRTTGFALLLTAAFIGSPCASRADDPPATQPATTQVGDIDLRDYCTVLLARKLQDHLQVTDEQRANLAEMKVKLNAYLHNAAGNIQGTRVTPGLVAGRAETALAMAGKMVRNELTPAQRAKLVAMFDDKTLEPIQVGAKVLTQNGLRSTTVISGVNLTYTHFGEKDAGNKTSDTPAPAATSATPPKSVPTSAPAVRSTARATPSTGPVAGSPRSRRTDLDVDVPGAIKGLQSDSMPRQVFAATQLARAAPDKANRPKVLELLRPAVKDTADEQWARFVQAYCVWADDHELDAVKAILKAADANKRLHQKEEASAAACTALVRLDPKAAAEAINERINNDLFRVCLLNDLGRLSKIDGPAQERAIDLHAQIMDMAAHGLKKVKLNP